MRILVVADIHANRAALDAIAEPHDVCLCLGDTVEYGPDPGACVDWVRAHADHGVRGNHDHGVVQNVDLVGAGGFRYLTMVTRGPTLAALDPSQRRYLATRPTTQMLTLDGHRFLLVHATPRDPLDEYTPCDPKAWEQRLHGIKADFVLVGHTHQQFSFPVGNSILLNPGSVGLPRDGDPRARYAIIDDGEVQLKQVPYDIAATIAGVEAMGIDAKAKAMLADVYRHGRYMNGTGNGHSGPIVELEPTT